MYPRFQEFIDYMNKTWTEGDDVERGPLFKISWWNHWSHLSTRTNNTNEAYNYRIIVKLGNKPHPNIWFFIEFIQEEDFQNSLKVEQVFNGKYKGRSRTNEYRKDLAISKAKCSFLESDRGFEATEDLLESFRTLCPKPLFTK